MRVFNESTLNRFKKRKGIRLLTLIFNLVPPEMVKLVSSKITVCQGEIITFNCSANSNPAVYTYQWYVNETMVNEVVSTGVWNRTMTTGGVFVYKCNVNNTIGTAMSESVTITVNGNKAVFFFNFEQKMSWPKFCSS